MARSYQEMLAQSQQPRDQGFVKNLLMGFTKPVRRAFESARYASSAPGEYNPIFESSTAQDIQSAIEDPTENVLKSIATVGSFAVPGATGIRGGALTGATAGAIGGYGTSEKGNELNDILFGTLTGGALGGAIGGVSSKLGGKQVGMQRVGRKLESTADAIELKGLRAAAGGKAPKALGGAILEKDVNKLGKALGYKFNGVDDIQRFSDDVLYKYGGEIAQNADKLSQSGVKVSVADLRASLLDDLANSKSTELRKPIQKVLDELDVVTGGADEISPLELYKLKQEWGILGKFRPNVPKGEEFAASAYQKLYKYANDALEKTFTKNGYADFRTTNELLETAIKANRWLDNTEMLSGSPGISDKMQDAIIAATAGGGLIGGAPGALASGSTTAALQQVMGSPAGQRGIASGIRRLGGVMGGTTLPTVPSRATSLAGLLAGYAGATPQDQEQPQAQGLEAMMPEQFAQPQVDTQKEVADLTLQLFLETGDIKEAATLAELLVTSKYGSTQMGGGQELASGEFARKALTAQQAGYRALDTLNRNPSVTGKTQGIENFFNDLTGQANDATSYNQQIETFRTLFMSALGGASLMPAEIERFEKSLPKVTDSPERAKQKMEMLLPELDNLIYKNGAPDPTQEDLMQMLGY